MIKNAKIKIKMILSFGIIIFFSTLIIIVSTINMWKTTEDTQSLYNIAYKTNDIMWSMRKSTISIERGIYKGISTIDNIKSENAVNENSKAATDLVDSLELLKKMFETDESSNLLNTLENLINQAAAVRIRLNEYILNDENEKALDVMEREYEPIFKQSNDAIIELSKLVTQDAEDFATQSKLRGNTSIITNLILLMISLISAILIAVAMTKNLVIPIQEIDYAIEEVSKGNLNVNIDYVSKDELGNLANNTKRTIKELQKYIESETDTLEQLAHKNMDVTLDVEFLGDFVPIKVAIVTIIDFLNDMIFKTKEASSQVTQSSNQMASVSQSLAIGTTEQSSSIQELVATINEVSEHVEINAKNAKGANTLSTNSVSEVDKANEYMQNLLKAMYKIDTKSQEIANIIKIIDNISSQTNLLSLNASIEAARAGENGAGFAVVANEIGKLANECGEAVKNTSELIAESMNAVNEGSKLADETAGILLNIVSASNETSELVNKISTACNQQSQALEEILKGIQQVAEVVETNSATAEESSASSESLLSQSETLTHMLNEYKIKLVQ